jgi:hypothetical protein
MKIHGTPENLRAMTKLPTYITSNYSKEEERTEREHFVGDVAKCATSHFATENIRDSFILQSQTKQLFLPCHWLLDD